MVSKKHPAPSPRRFWQAAFLAAELPTLLKGRRLSPEGAAHIAAEYADAALAEYVRRYGRHAK